MTAVLVSGEGTILEAILERTEVGVVAADRRCRGLDVAARAGVEGVLVDRRRHGGFGAAFDRDGFTAELGGALESRGTDLVCMAGFGTILADAFFERFEGCVLNTHPSLLPAFPGWHAVRDAIAEGATTTGCTVHVATRDLDAGPILRQQAVAVRPGDDEATLHERIKQVERRLYPETILEVRRAMAAGAPPASIAPAAGVQG